MTPEKAIMKHGGAGRGDIIIPVFERSLSSLVAGSIPVVEAGVAVFER